jgi:hypothetical protein
VPTNNRKKHGMCGTGLHATWKALRGRCNNPNHYKYPRYGGRGIGYDPTWEQFELFYLDMAEGHMEGYVLDRIDNDQGYNKENCRWLTKAEHAHKTHEDRRDVRRCKV